MEEKKRPNKKGKASGVRKAKWERQKHDEGRAMKTLWSDEQLVCYESKEGWNGEKKGMRKVKREGGITV